jgi:hypothetical protein
MANQRAKIPHPDHQVVPLLLGTNDDQEDSVAPN